MSSKYLSIRPGFPFSCQCRDRTPTDEPLAGKTLVYMLKHPSRAAATANWAAFHGDPEWMQVSAASETNGKLVEKVDSTFLQLTDFSPHL